VDVAESGAEALGRSARCSYDLVVSDIRMPDMSGIDLLRELKAASPAALVVLMTAFASTQTAVAALKLGAYDYLTKPFDVEEFRIVIRNALERQRLHQENVDLRRELQARRGAASLIGRSEPMRRLVDLIGRVADTPATILLTGERGTGKELVARGIHDSSRRRDGKFVSVNCAAIQESLLESELFGHVRGAFTGAASAHEGLFESASGGTILLDEVGEMSGNMQAKLLRVLQERALRRVGGTDEIAVDVRVIASTNRDLAAQVAEGAFRPDLYDRLNVITVQVPALRERREDVPLLVEHFLRQAAAEMGRAVTGVSAAAMKTLESYDWPGNVRELENAIQRAVALETSDTIQPDSLPEAVVSRKSGAPRLQVAEGFSLEGHLDDLRRQLIAEALERSGGKIVDAARTLGISFRALRYYAKKYALR
jgi:two-component system response regulator PilR (NtrC family)